MAGNYYMLQTMYAFISFIGTQRNKDYKINAANGHFFLVKSNKIYFRQLIIYK